MPLFRSHRESAKRANRTILQFFAVMALLAALFAVAVAGRYVFGWW
jgi:hypothetical protein